MKYMKDPTSYRNIILQTVLLTSIICLGAFFRFYNINWDNGQHLHPDERFLTMVGNAMKMPNSINEYISPQKSTFNPANIGFPFFVYGIFPLILNQLVAMLLHNTSYNDFTLQGRILSGAADIALIFIIYRFVLLLEKHYHLPRETKFIAALFYSLAVLPIQLSHFFAVDTFLNLFMFTSFYFVVCFLLERKLYGVFLSAFFLGLALGSKITGIFILSLNFIIIIYSFLSKKHISYIEKYIKNKNYFIHFFSFIFLITIYLFVSYITFRFIDPYKFVDTNIFHTRFDQVFISNLQQLRSWNSPSIWFPPAVQWISTKPILYGLSNLIFWGIGPLFFCLVMVGIYYIVKHQKHLVILMTVIFTIIFFTYQSLQFAKPMRYFLPVYPFLAIFAAIGFAAINKYTSAFLRLALLVLLFIYPFSYLSIYVHPHTRIAASEWIYTSIPNNAIILWEHWDDPLPLLLENNHGKSFQTYQLPVFDEDTNEKWQKMNELLNKSNYLILSSNRTWRSIMHAPKKYPIMSQFYKNLLENKSSYKKIKEFTSYPSLQYLGIPITFSDENADESFTVYDHPKVMIFKNDNH